MGGVESSAAFEDNRQKYKDFREMLSDTELDDDETRELIKSYYSKCQEIHEETRQACSELQREREYYEEMTNMSRDEIRVLQSLGGFQGSERDGLRGPNTFAAYMQFGNEYPLLLGLSPKQVVEKYNLYIGETFESLDEDARKDVQRKVGTHDDGTFGPNTLRKIGENFSEVKDVFSFEFEGGIGVDSEVPILEVDEELDTETIDASVGAPELTETIPTEQVVDTAEEMPRDHHPEEVSIESELQTQTEILTEEEKIENFIADAKDVPRVLIRFLQAGIGAGVDGAFGPNSAQAAIEKYPDAQSFEEIMQQEGIPMESDGLLPGGGGVESRDAFREMYGEYVSVLEDNLNIPHGFVDAITRQETKYGGWKLMSPTGCKGMMQLSTVAIEDMKTNHRGDIRNYRESFRNLELDKLMSLSIGDTGETIRNSIPTPIIDTLYKLNNPETSSREYNSGIEELKQFIKGDNSYFNHAVNMIVGSVYLSGVYNDHSRSGGRGNIRATADLYNAAPNERAGYRANVERFYNEIRSE